MKKPEEQKVIKKGGEYDFTYSKISYQYYT